MAVLHITREQYRSFAEIAKAHGCVLSLSTSAEMKCWGEYSPMAAGVVLDATDSNSRLIEKSTVLLARSVDADVFRSANRPELDWRKLEDHEIFPFLLWHEIGHKVNNFDVFSIVTIADPDTKSACLGYVKTINEVLADRFSWSKIRHGEPAPMGETGQRLKAKVADGLDFLTEHAGHTSAFTVTQLDPGQYRCVPKEMLGTPWKARYIGTKVAEGWRSDG